MLNGSARGGLRRGGVDRDVAWGATINDARLHGRRARRREDAGRRRASHGSHATIAGGGIGCSPRIAINGLTRAAPRMADRMSGTTDSSFGLDVIQKSCRRPTSKELFWGRLPLARDERHLRGVHRIAFSCSAGVRILFELG